MKKLLILFAFITIVTHAHAQNQYYVSTSGSNSNSGTSLGSPWADCTKALASSGGAVVGASGAVINFVASSTTFAGCPAINRGGTSASARLALRCTAPVTAATHCKIGGPFNVTSANFVDIGGLPLLGFEYTNPGNDNAVDVVWQCGNNTTCSFGGNVRVLGNNFHDIGQNVSSGCPLAGVIEIPNKHGVSLPGPPTVIGNIIDHYGTSPNTTCNVAEGIYILVGGAIVQNNIVSRIATGAIQYYDQACNSTISNNIFMTSRVGIIHYGSNGCTPGLNSDLNNIVINNQTGILTGQNGSPNSCSSGRTMLFSNNDLFGNGTDFNNGAASCETRQNPKSENPTTTFVNYTGNAATGDYHLKAGSTMIAGGTSTGVSGGTQPFVPSTDIAGTVRPSGGTQDIGPYAFSSAGVPVVNFSPSPVAYGTVPVATSSTLSATLTNAGSTDLTFSAATISGTNAADYSVLSTTCASPLAAGVGCSYSLRFTPSATGARSASLTLNDNAAGSPHQLPLTGTGGAPALTLNPTSTNFGVVVPGSCSSAQTTTATNTGSANVILGNETIGGTNPGDFTFGGVGTCNGGQTLTPGQSCLVSAKFCPVTTGARSGNISAPSNDPASPDLWTLTGTGGAPVATVTPSSGSCGSVQVGASSTCQVFTLTNTGNIDLTNIVVGIQ